MKAKEHLLKALRKEGVDHIFMVPGGLVDPFLTAFDDEPGITPIVTAQEGGAAFMADGYGRASRKFGVCLCIGGPGLTNTTTAVLTAKSDHTPLLIISGEVPTSMEGLGAFQDASEAGLNDYSILASSVSYSCIIENPILFHHHLYITLTKMLGPIRNPVHLCIPKDIQEMEIPGEFINLEKSFYYSPLLDKTSAEASLEDINVDKIAILAGEGLSSAGKPGVLMELSDKLGIPVATTLRAKGLFPEDHPNSLGVFGYAGTRHSSAVLLDEELDALIVLGSGLNMRDSLFWTQKLNPKRLIQVNIDPSAYAARYKDSKLVLGDAKAYIEYLLSQKSLFEQTDRINQRKTWIEKIKQSPRLFDVENMSSNAVPIHPARVIKELRMAAPRDTVLFVDSGAHRAFCGHYWESYAPDEYISATNLGPMGWAIPASIGGKAARPEAPCCVVTGDGCMLMHGMEIHTASRYQIAVVFVAINNAALGNVYLRAKSEGKTAKELTSIPDRDWAGFARSLGVDSETVSDPSQLSTTFKRAFQANKPYLVEIKCDKECTTPIEDFSEAKKAWSYHD